MGDAADDALDRELSMLELAKAEDDCLAEDGDGFGPAFGGIYRRRPRFDGVCKRCHAGGFRWGKLANGKWRLFDSSGKMHSCSPKPKHEIDTLADLEKFTHWKVGDGMKVGREKYYDDEQGFIIKQIAIVQDRKDPHAFHICYFDKLGKCRGDQHVKLVEKPNQ